MCECPPGYLDSNCSVAINCKSWDANLSVWRTEGITTVLAADGSGVSCDTLHLTTFGGLISIPTSVEELLAELADAFTFNTFSMSEMFDLLSNFSIGENPTIFTIVVSLAAADILSLLILGYYRGRRARMRRQREDTMYEGEVRSRRRLGLLPSHRALPSHPTSIYHLPCPTLTSFALRPCCSR